MKNMTRLDETIVEAFSALFEQRRFRKTAEHYDARYFGNEVVVYTSPEMALKFVKDRSEIFVDVGPPDESSWFMAPRLFEYLHLANDLYGPADPALLRRHAILLDQAYGMVADLFLPERRAESENELRKFWKIKAEELFPSDDEGEYGPQ